MIYKATIYVIVAFILVVVTAICKYKYTDKFSNMLAITIAYLLYMKIFHPHTDFRNYGITTTGYRELIKD
jgi:hypothetical protein